MRALVITNSITRRDSKSIEKYLTEVSRYDVLSADEELALFKRYKDGDQMALRKIIQCNLRFVISVAKQYQNTGMSLDDLINEGNIGLVRAAQRFDETRGFKFISYAVWWIRQAILQALNEKGKKIRLPISQLSKSQQVYRQRNELYQELEREPSAEELAESMDMEAGEIERCLSQYKNCRSLSEPLDSSDDSSPLETVLADEDADSPDSAVAEKESLQIAMQHLLTQLSPREVEVLSMHYGIQRKRAHSLQDIGESLDLSRERIRQIRDRALRKLRRKLHTDKDLFLNS